VFREPTCSLPLYFLSMPSLWYFQNCFEASLPATRVRIFFPPVVARRQPTSLSCDLGMGIGIGEGRDRYQDAHLGTQSGRRHPRRQ
jgi:hypothetical protein